MPQKIIALEELDDKLKKELDNLMKLVPADQRDDKNLQRLIAFRLKLDGDAPTRDYLVRHIEFAKQCSYKGSLFDFLKDDQKTKDCGFDAPGPPDEIG